MECANCGKKISSVRYTTNKGNNICQKCFLCQEKSKEPVLTKMMSHQSGRGRVTTEEDILELIKKTDKQHFKSLLRDVDSNKNPK
jgi:recombinational DNA repair protein (RecF pathway)